MSELGMDGWSLLAQATVNREGGSGWPVFVALLVVFVVPFVGGALLARVLKLPDLSMRISAVLFAAIFGITPFVWQYVEGSREQADWQTRHAAWEQEGKAEGRPEPRRPEPRTWRSAIKLGIDLRGGTNLVFRIKPSEKEINSDVMSQMVTAVSKRVNPTGTEEIIVRPVGKDRIEVIIPGADPEQVDRIKGRIVRLGSLEFAILANEKDHRDIIERAKGIAENVLGSDNQIIASWRDVALDSAGRPKETYPVDNRIAREIDRDGKKVLQHLVIIEPKDQQVTGQLLDNAGATTDQNGRPAVSFTFRATGGYRFLQLTTKYRPRADGTMRQLAILLDGRIHSAPNIRQPIGANGIIEGKFTQEEVNELVGVLKSGALEVPLDHEPVSEFSVGPLLAHDVQEKGLNAVLVSSILVFVFMLGYYMFAGAVADVCLMLNIVLILGAMAFIDATFTLPGIAGIVLTIGMAVDANVLIYERMREEQLRGSSLRMTIQNGFDKALSAIIDSNVTTLITAVILYMIGTDQIRGFAVTLFIGLVASMFTAVFFGRLIFTIMERKRWLKRLRMLTMIRVPNIDWISYRVPAFALSGVLIAVGLAALAARGRDNLDIDFTGGTMVTFEFTEPQDLEKVRSALMKSDLGNDVSLERLELLGQKATGDLGKKYRLRTKEQKIDVVRRAVNSSLADAGFDLRRVTVAPGEIVDLSETEVKADRPTKFPGGREVELTFSSGVRTATAEDYFAGALRTLMQGEREKYPEPQALFAAEGTQRPVAAPGEQQEDVFTTFRLMASSSIPADDLKSALDAMQAQLASEPVFDEINTFESSVAGEMQEAAIIAIVFSMIAIVAYIWFRFERVSWGLAALSALFHDTLVVLGAIPLAAYLSRTPIGPILGLEDFKINLAIVAAILTVIGYSLNDTIVIFDRIREVRGKNPVLTREMINLSCNQTLSRTILTALTVLIVIVIMYVLGGEGLHGFAFCMLIGVVSGTWSTLFIANPVLYWLMNRPGRGTVPARAPLSVPGQKTAAAG